MALTMAPMSRRKLQPSTENGFAQRLVSIRTSRELTQTQLAEMTGLTQRTISHYETGAGYPPAPTVVDLATALEVSTDELLGAKPIKSGKLPQMDAETKRLWTKFQQLRTLPDKDQRAVIRMVNSLSKNGV
jgi:transcriptional regulator with XRE-family HTH domain